MKKNDHLEHLALAARDADAAWDDARASRVLSSALDRRERRVARNRIVRRALVVGSAAAVVGMIFLRGASASPNASSSSASNVEVEPAATQLAASSFGDAGYARD